MSAVSEALDAAVERVADTLRAARDAGHPPTELEIRCAAQGAIADRLEQLHHAGVIGRYEMPSVSMVRGEIVSEIVFRSVE